MTEATALYIIEEDPTNKFQVELEPLSVVPHKCSGCGRYSSNDPENPLQFIHWNFDVEFYGYVYICVGCVEQIARRLGFMSPKSAAELNNTANRFMDFADQVEQENRELRNALGSLGVIFDHSPAAIKPLRSVEDVDDNDETRVGDQNDIVLTDSEGETGSTEQTTESGSTDVHDNEDDLLRLIDDI